MQLLKMNSRTWGVAAYEKVEMLNILLRSLINDVAVLNAVGDESPIKFENQIRNPK